MATSELTLPPVDVVAQRDPPPPTQPATSPIGAPVPYIRRKIEITVEAGKGPFGEGPGKTTVTLRGYRCSVTVTLAGQTAQVACQARIWGMPFKLMQQLSTYGDIFAAQRQFQMTIMAGDDVGGLIQVFNGTVTEAYFDGESQPDVAFQMIALEGTLPALKPVPPISIAGSVDVATVMASLAQTMGVPFENHNVTAKLRDIYYPGTAFQQMRRLAQHAGINARLENGVLAIWPGGTSRNTGGIPLITPLSGLRNYPTFSSQFIQASCQFLPLKYGNKIAIESALWNHARKYFYIIGYTYTLESEMPNGPWFTMFKASAQPLK
jgi:hypothetical protein